MTGLYPEALAAIALWPVRGSPSNPRQWPVAALAAIWSLRPGCHIAVRAAGPSGDPPQSRTSMFFPLPPQKEVVT